MGGGKKETQELEEEVVSENFRLRKLPVPSCMPLGAERRPCAVELPRG